MGQLKVYTSCRYTFAYVGFFGCLCSYALRFNMSVAIVCMTRDPVGTKFQNYSNITTTIINSSQESESKCFLDTNNITSKVGELEWDRRIRGFVLSTFFWGYIFTQIPGGILASHFGGKKVVGAGILLATIATYLLPIAARFNYVAVYIIRFILGFGCGVVFPALHGIIARWAPLYEKSKIVAFTYAGTMIGNIIIFPVGGILCEYGFDGGWPSIFYITAMASTIWLILFYFCVFNGPEEHPRIKKEELDYIQRSIGKITKSTLKDTPWKSIFTSRAVWGIVLAHMISNVGSYTIMNLLPQYMKDVLKFNIKQNGLYAALPYVGMFFSGIAAGLIADSIRRRGVRTSRVRKGCSIFAWLISSSSLICASFVTCEKRILAVAFIVIASSMIFFGSRGGYMANHIDIAPRYADILYGISNTAGTIPGIIMPLLAGQIVKNGHQTEWQILFYICGGCFLIGIVLVTILFEGEVQEWAKEEAESEKDENIKLNMTIIKDIDEFKKL